MPTPEPQNNVEVTVESQRYADEITKFVAELASESERAAVVLGAARIDLQLEKALKKILRHHPDGMDNLFDADRPLGTFSAKISLSLRIGLLNQTFEHALQMVRKLRNDFAHSAEKISLSASPHSGRVDELTKCFAKDELFEKLKPVLAKGIADERLVNFCCAVAILISILTVAEVRNAPSEQKYVCELD